MTLGKGPDWRTRDRSVQRRLVVPGHEAGDHRLRHSSVPRPRRRWSRPAGRCSRGRGRRRCSTTGTAPALRLAPPASAYRMGQKAAARKVTRPTGDGARRRRERRERDPGCPSLPPVPHQLVRPLRGPGVDPSRRAGEGDLRGRPAYHHQTRTGPRWGGDTFPGGADLQDGRPPTPVKEMFAAGLTLPVGEVGALRAPFASWCQRDDGQIEGPGVGLYHSWYVSPGTASAKGWEAP